jgi:DNA-binding NarL/FixJ family response regulator
MIKVIIADDSDVFRSRLVNLLSENSSISIVGEARDGMGASILIEKYKPDVVILDIRMPRETGFNVLKQAKKQKSVPIVVMLTNYPYKQYKERCQKDGADYFFDKATEFEKIPVVLEEIINSHSGKNLGLCDEPQT